MKPFPPVAHVALTVRNLAVSAYSSFSPHPV
jgi:hypothetical protein